MLSNTGNATDGGAAATSAGTDADAAPYWMGVLDVDAEAATALVADRLCESTSPEKPPLQPNVVSLAVIRGCVLLFFAWVLVHLYVSTHWISNVPQGWKMRNTAASLPVRAPV